MTEETYPNAALAILCLARGNGSQGAIVGPGADCAVRLRDVEAGRGHLALYRNGKAWRAWTWELGTPGVARIGFRELRRIITERERE